MDQTLLERILRSPKLPTLPAIAVRILDLTQDVNVSISALASTIENDQAIAARVLRTVNSSFYGLRRSCSSINQAVVLLGLASVKTLALSFSLVSTLRKRGEDEFDHVAYWRRSIYSAVAGRIIARQAGLARYEEAFLGGLLQDIGMMAMYQTLGERYIKVVSAVPEHRALLRHELAELELQHPEVGAMLAQRWRLPPELIIPIKYHEQPTAAPEEHADLVRAVGLANIACDVLSSPQSGPNLRRFRARAARWFGFDQPHCDDLLRQITAAAHEVSSLFVLNIGQQADVDSILSRAEDQLARIDEQFDGDREDSPMNRLVSDSHEFDPLTGVLTRRALLVQAMELFDESRMPDGPVAVVAISVDGFTNLTRQTEAENTDSLLVETAAVLEHFFMPQGARVARWEAGVFVAVAPGLGAAAASAQADRVRTTALREAQTWFPAELRGKLSWSAGVATIDDPSAPSASSGLDLFTQALTALDAARASGGNCTRDGRHRLAA